MTKPFDENPLAYLEQIRWQGKPQCPYCGSTKCTALKNERRYHCNTCFTSYSVTVGTLFHKSHVELQKWFQAILLVLSAPKKLSVRQLAKEIDVNKNTAYYMLIRIQKAMQEECEILTNLSSLETFNIQPDLRENSECPS